MFRPYTTNRTRRAFSLVELVVVILILGILAAVAAPRMFDTATEARNSATRQSLFVLRNAIQLYLAKNAQLPGADGTEATFKADLVDMLNGPFPRAEVGNVGDTVRIETGDSPLTASGDQSWAYNSTTGQFICNHQIGADW